MRNFILAAAAASLAMPMTPALAQHHDRYDRGHHDRGHYDRGHHDRGHHYGSRAQWRHYDWNRRPPGYRHYYADRYYRDGSYYQPRRLYRTDRVYRGSDGRYYCRRSDGTTGLIVGGVLGGLIGNSLSNGRSSTLGTLLGVAGGAALGSSIDRGQIQCR